MSTTDPEHKPNIFGPLTTPELLHNRLMDILNTAASNDSELLDVNAEPENGEVDSWLYLTGRQSEDQILTLGPDNKFKYIEASIYYNDEYRDAPGLGRDADGHPAEIMRVDHMAELAHRTIEILFDVKDSPDPVYDDEGEQLSHQNGWKVSYDADTGWNLRHWKDADPEVAGDPKYWVVPTEEDIDTLRLILEHSETRTARN